ncbi:DNA polymerase V [Pantoea sp. PSNIH1]|nr:DNA polymerase V [Pantoea sp. PSNIH1]
MPREYQIKEAFISSIKREPSGRSTVTTADFVEELKRVNWHFTLKQANDWIRSHTTTFRDASTQEGENMTWFRFNPNGGL